VVDRGGAQGITVRVSVGTFASRSTELKRLFNWGPVQTREQTTVVHKGLIFHGFARPVRRPQAMEIFCMSFCIQGRSWITGASSGIGRGAGPIFLARARKVILMGSAVPTALQAVATPRAPERHAGSLGHLKPPDYDPHSLSWSNRPGAGAGRIDVLIKQRWRPRKSGHWNTSFEVYRQLIEVDYLAPLALTQALLPRMVRAGWRGIAIVQHRWPARSALHCVLGYCGCQACSGSAIFEALRAEVEESYGIGVSINSARVGYAPSIGAECAGRHRLPRVGVRTPNIDKRDRSVDAAKTIPMA